MQKWNPLDTVGRRRLLQECASPEHVGDTLLKAFVTSENGVEEWIISEMMNIVLI